MKTAFKDYLTFSRRDRKGIFWLLLILLLLIIFRVCQHWIPRYERDYSEEIAALVKQLEEYNAQSDTRPPAKFQDEKTDEDNDLTSQYFSADEENASSSNPKRETHSATKSKRAQFHFDPNTLDRSGWMDLGFSQKQTDVILNYRSKGGSFQKKEDVLKLYCVDEDKYVQLEPWIQIAADNIPRRIDLNRADTIELKKLKGIGSYYARKIVEYRDALGGIHSFDQLTEIWKMRPETIELLRDNCDLDPSAIRPVQINQLSLEELKLHPYFDWNVANALFNYRELHGPFKDWENLRKVRLMNSELEMKLKPYIAFDD